MSFLRPLSFLALCSMVMVAACAADDQDSDGSTDPDVGASGDGYGDELINAEKAGQASQKWIYNGPLPKLSKAEIVASLKSHTVRVTGTVPASFTGTFPFYAEVKQVGDVRKLTVVYPIATGALDPSTGAAPSAAGAYNTIYGIAYTPTNTHAPWGGFPFMMYNAKRGIAFHGPITSVTNVTTGDLEWKLIRGPVSHGCNRMDGAHIVEMANLIGIDMSKPHTASEQFTLGVKTTITPEFDTFDGKQIDVDYPAQKAVVRPTGATAKVYPTWNSDDFPTFVCPYQAGRALDAHHCDTAGTNRRDPATGKYLVEPSKTPWIGATCSAPTDCSFTTSKGAPSCSLGDAGKGVCTVTCAGGCPDKPGEAATFCATFPDNTGRCVAKAESLNNQCADVPGTTPVLADRFIGTSTSKPAQATVCMPTTAGSSAVAPEN